MGFCNGDPCSRKEKKIFTCFYMSISKPNVQDPEMFFFERSGYGCQTLYGWLVCLISLGTIQKTFMIVRDKLLYHWNRGYISPSERDPDEVHIPINLGAVPEGLHIGGINSYGVDQSTNPNAITDWRTKNLVRPIVLDYLALLNLNHRLFWTSANNSWKRIPWMKFKPCAKVN